MIAQGVSGADALRALAHLDSAASTLFLGVEDDGVSADGSERYLTSSATDEQVRAVVGELAARSRPSPAVIPAVDEPPAIPSREEATVWRPRRGRRRSRPSLGPTLGLASAVAIFLAYTALFADRPALVADASAPAASQAQVPVSAPQAASAPVTGAVLTAEAPTANPASSTAPRVPDLAAAAPNAVPLQQAATATPPAPTSTPRPASATASPAAPTPTRLPPTAAPMADPTTGIEGRVTDAATGAPIPGAQVSYRGPASGRVTAGGDGRYRFGGLPPGAYDVSAEAAGYATVSNRTGVVERVLSTDNLALAPSPGGVVAPFETVVDQRSGRAVAAYGYTLRTGDTLRSVAERAGTAVAEILALNRLDDPDNVTPGQSIYLPASTFGQK